MVQQLNNLAEFPKNAKALSATLQLTLKKTLDQQPKLTIVASFYDLADFLISAKP